MGDTDAAGVPNRRIAHPRGRRASDLVALTPELQAEALAYAVEIARCLDVLTPMQDEQDGTTHPAWIEMKMAADALHRLLMTRKSQRPPLMTSPEPVEVPAWDGHPHTVAVVWRLVKDGDRAECQLVTHPLGAEIRMAAAGEHERSEAGRDSFALVDKAMGWKRQFQDKGWR